MRAEKIVKSAVVCVPELRTGDLEESDFVPVAIPARYEDSEHLKSDLEAHEIPAMLESERLAGDLKGLDGVPVLVPECRLEQASQIVGMIELNALDDGEEFEEEEEEEEEIEEFEELEDDDEFDEDLDDEEDDEDFLEEEEEEEEVEEEDEDEDLFYEDDEEF
ncbi:MAG: hypothetical protein GXY33_07310 [Phycisphaerae bacterium]|nr:hypothetical protein [Phycisphaerae bacterium]